MLGARNSASSCAAFKHHVFNWKNDLSTTLLLWELPIEVMGKDHSFKDIHVFGGQPMMF